MKLLFLYVFLAFNFNIYSFDNTKDSLKVKVLNIEYFSKSGCSDKAPLLVRVTYGVDKSEELILKMRHTYADGITICSSANIVDKKGNYVYEFCSQEGKEIEFKTVFVTNDGVESNEVLVFVKPEKSKIIAGTAPKTLKIN